MAPLLNTLDGTLDAFVQTYCGAREIKLDGDIFGVLFSGKEDYTPAEAVGLIEESADAHGLRIETLYDVLANRIAISEARFGKAAAADGAAIADQLFGERGIKAGWYIETTRDREGNTLWEIVIYHEGDILIAEQFYSREEAENYVRSFTNLNPIDGE